MILDAGKAGTSPAAIVFQAGAAEFVPVPARVKNLLVVEMFPARADASSWATLILDVAHGGHGHEHAYMPQPPSPGQYHPGL